MERIHELASLAVSGVAFSLASIENQGLESAVSVGLPPEPGFALEWASGHQARGCTGADGTGRR
jgi:hypothetical protein